MFSDEQHAITYTEAVKMTDEKKLRKKLSEMIRLSGKTQTEIARVTGISQTQISRYLNGKIVPSLLTFSTLCSFLDVDANDILCVADFRLD